MLAPYRKVRVLPLLLRQTTLEKYLTTPIFGVVGAIALHYYNWTSFKQENIYDHDGPEKDAKMLIDIGFGIPLGGIPVEIAYYFWSVKDEQKTRKELISV
ncbi:hypothetical protein Mgra_00001976 [Meloidogyne graminicola]|uniref:Uncharacterized protein n=1 Tax=Meloidogyne graminicola TaxID=189291 RepID=A0A8S9ZZ95_9BILA|nr:hypothetical protein Mgra_00001976 [Meloidogyne graminicola]